MTDTNAELIDQLKKENAQLKTFWLCNDNPKDTTHILPIGGYVGPAGILHLGFRLFKIDDTGVKIWETDSDNEYGHWLKYAHPRIDNMLKLLIKVAV